MKKLKTLFSIAICALFFSSCSSVSNLYSIGLKTIESPANAKQQFGETKVVNFKDNETKIVNFKDGKTNKYRYEDDYINIVWYTDSKYFYFDLTNKSKYTIKINWDDISYVDYNGKVGRVMHSGIKYIERTNSQPSSTIPKRACLSEVLIPTKNIYFNKMLFGGSWEENNLIPSNHKDDEAKFVGKTITIMMPIMIENVQNDYTFIFSIDKLLNKTKK